MEVAAILYAIETLAYGMKERESEERNGKKRKEKKRRDIVDLETDLDRLVSTGLGKCRTSQFLPRMTGLTSDHENCNWIETRHAA